MIFFGNLSASKALRSSVTSMGLAVGACGFAPHLAFAKAFITQPGNIPAGRIQLSPFLGLGFNNFVEAGLVGSWLVVSHGFIPALNNSVHAEGAVFQDLAGRHRTGSLGGRMRWDFHLLPNWTAYGAPGFAVRFGDSDVHTGPEITGVVGGFFHMSPSLSLRAETDVIGHYGHTGVRGGVTFHL
ncbi:MAG: hypothetical protein IOD12_04685 [Silvanigrellales bacterium]|nr:hypothetical protein [Silvanigrellales bacterium]